MTKKTALVLMIFGLTLTTFSNVSLGGDDLQYVPTNIQEGIGAGISGVMAKGAFAESAAAHKAALANAADPPVFAAFEATAQAKHLQGVMFSAATVGVLGSLGYTISNMFKADEGGGGNPNTPGGPPPGPGAPRFEPGPDLDGDGPPDPTTPDGNTDGLNNGTNSGNTSLGNADVALDLLNSNPDSGFGAESLGGRDLASSGTGSGTSSGGGSGGGDSSGSLGKNGAALLSQGIEKELSSWNPQDLAKLKAGDEDLMRDLMASLGMGGDPNGIDFSMFSNLLDGILKGEHEKPLENGVLGSELMNKEFSIFEAIKKTTVVAATEFHPKARIALFQKPTAVVAKNETVSNKTDDTKNVSLPSIMPRKIMNNGAVHE